MAIVFAVCAFNVYKIVRNYLQDRNTYETISESASKDGFTGDINWKKLMKINPETVGWIYLEDTIIDYPIVQGTDNDKYLSMKFDGEWGGCGTLFADCNTENAFEQFSTIVYGHHMKDGSMFNGLKKYKDPEYAKEHPRFELITPNEKYHLDVALFLNPRSDSDVYTPNVSDSNREHYLNYLKNSAEYSTDVDVDTDDKLVLLSTCAYEYEGARYVVVGKLTEW